MFTILFTTYYLFISTTFASFYPNETYYNTTTPNGTATSSCIARSTPTIPPPRPSGPPCLSTFYTSELQIVNSRYPIYNDSQLHYRTNMFMALRQREDTFQIATQIQFNDINVPNSTTCNLKLFVPPGDVYQMFSGPQPVLFIYQVARETASIANWESYEPGNLTKYNPPYYGQINGTLQSEQREYYNGYYDAGSGPCNETMTFQIGMALDGGKDVNFWQFIDTQPPVSPVQGFQMWAGEQWCRGS